jgi:Fe-S cluster assembly scaffold protein SufB
MGFDELEGRKDMEITGDATLRIADGTRATVVVAPAADSVVELDIGKGCRIEVYLMPENGAGIRQVNRIGEGSRVDTYGIWLDGGSGSLLNSLEGPRSEAYEVQVFVGSGKGRLHLNSVLRHASQDTKGDILVKGVVRDQASARLDGMIRIEKRGGGAESFLSEHVMLLNPGAHASANPELEIENNDVSSRHAASVSQIDEDKIFYMVSRGLPREEARKLIIEGFLGAAVEKVADPRMRGRLMEKAMAAL